MSNPNPFEVTKPGDNEWLTPFAYRSDRLSLRDEGKR